ncbi:hypothetical protein [Pseudomonas sp. IT-P218]|uniref:hypothetical protein n=1 Tax=Pseudomonas sp. IT-P218 TaxID=3026449 RepID=UPI0039E09667
MGTALIAKNSNAENSGLRKFVPPVTRNLEAWHFLNTDVMKAARNYAMGDKPDAQVIGAPAEFGSYIQFKGQANYLQTQVVDAPTQTVFSVIRSKDTLADVAHSPAFYGTYSTAAPGAALYWDSTNAALVKTGARYTDAGQTAIGSTPISQSSASNQIVIGEWSLIVDVTKADFNRSINATKNSTRTSAAVTYGRVPAAVPFRIGSAYPAANSFAGTADMALWAHYSTELTDAEIALIIARIRAYMSQRHGIVV